MTDSPGIRGKEVLEAFLEREDDRGVAEGSGDVVALVMVDISRGRAMPEVFLEGEDNRGVAEGSGDAAGLAAIVQDEKMVVLTTQNEKEQNEKELTWTRDPKRAPGSCCHSKTSLMTSSLKNTLQPPPP